MLEAIIIGIIVPLLLWPFFPKWMKDTQKPKKKIVLFKNWQPNNTGGLRWMGNKKRLRKEQAKKKQKYFWDD